MENIKEFVIKNKKFSTFYLIWFFIHIMLFLSEVGDVRGFWPLQKTTKMYGHVFHERGKYGIDELFFYLAVPLIVFFIWSLFSDDIKKLWEKINPNQ